jgi:mannose-6-phosphate isomerase class I
VSGTEAVFDLPVREFRLSRIETAPGREHTALATGGAEILLCLEGEARIEEGPTLAPGRAALVAGACGAYAIRGTAVLYRVTVPLD